MYTIEQRHEVYKKLLNAALNPFMVKLGERPRLCNSHGLCYMYSAIISDDHYFYLKAGEILPELWEKATNLADINLWNNWDERIQSLKECIQETSNHARGIYKNDLLNENN